VLELTKKPINNDPVVKPGNVVIEEMSVVNEETGETVDGGETQPATRSEYIAQNLISGAQYLSSGVLYSADKATEYIRSGGEKIKSTMTPAQQPVQIDPKLKKTVQTVRYGTHVSVRVSTYLLNKLGELASSAAKTVAPHLKEGTTSLLARTGIMGNKENATGYVDSFCTVAGSSIQGVAIVYDSFDQAAKTLGKNLTDQTVRVVEHK
jgi:spartin